MSDKKQMIIDKGIVIGSRVRRINDEHGRMEVGDEAIVVDIINTKICLDKDWEDGSGFTHDITNIEKVD